MFSKRNSGMNEDGDISKDIKEMAQTLEDVLNSWGDEAGEKSKHARQRAKTVLAASRVHLHGHGRAVQRARDAASCTCSWMQDRPLYSAGIAALIGIAIGALLVSRRQPRQCSRLKGRLISSLRRRA
ncbi:MULTISPECIES: DUF883 family protein [Tenebrionibacter/Tenebrionicola group]|jgi:ElaB/YqjD/DUF883 family membrane-anchored ribosome-binding protein|uniref:DUF883 family protein n=2 Tax=Tenebrionibacter/Tenebrionicola group TaxID=2969848 RepID=A0A8K0V2V8_9ENTR|nr:MULTISPECIES: DUF883 family protein [Tenebrionibacter/Tenebrionicola group]MBK4715811.1 DUF883 family protein [Tenebrionibacter intestinalis]MBV5096509.1 DUF883 family protein [Tenebrionicola larvae]